MDEITELIHSNGCAFELGLEEVSLILRGYVSPESCPASMHIQTFRKMYEPLYKEVSPEVVKQIKDIRYGPADRNFLDVCWNAGITVNQHERR